jgi:hypothetical protein
MPQLTIRRFRRASAGFGPLRFSPAFAPHGGPLGLAPMPLDESALSVKIDGKTRWINE